MSHRTCSFDGCGRKHYGHGLCATHCKQRRKGRQLTPIAPMGDVHARFAHFARQLPNGCVEWTGCRDDRGYGQLSAGGRIQFAHRWRWQRDNGPLDPKIALDHYMYPEMGCIGPSCVLHVRPASWRENVLRGGSVASVNLAKTHCPQGHPYAGDNLYVDRRVNGRACRTCRRDRDRMRRGYQGNPPTGERTHCPQGHAYDRENTYVLPQGGRSCRACGRAKSAAYNARRKAAQQT